MSPTGSDSNPGTYSQPVQQLSYARDLVRRMNTHMTGNITVYLEGGTYRLTEPLQFTHQDSGTNGFNVIWSSMPNTNAVISGGLQITDWSLSDPIRNIWSAPVPASLRTRQIYVNGMRATMAAGALPVKVRATATGYIASSSIMDSWPNPQEIEFVYTGGGPIWNVKTNGLGQWTEPICPVASIRGRVITMAEPCWNNSTRRIVEPDDKKRSVELVGPPRLSNQEQPSYVENALPLLDHPGQFYLDTAGKRLYYIPRRGEDMNRADVEAPALQSLLMGNGTAEAPIHNLVFSNLELSYATWLQPSSKQGFSEIQANYTITGKRGYATEGLGEFAPHGTYPYGAWTKEPGNVQFSYDRHLSFLSDRFVHLGGAALNLDNGSQRDEVNGCIFTDVSGNGLEIGNVNMPQANPLSETAGITVTNNHLYDLPVEFHGGVAIDVGYASESTISHNQIDHTSYTAISIGWGGWLDKIKKPPIPNFSRDNVIDDNLIYDYLQVLSDGGGIYTQGVTGSSMKDGERVVGNVIHDQLDWGHALYTDNGATFITYTDNVLYNDYDDWGAAHLDYRPPRAGEMIHLLLRITIGSKPPHCRPLKDLPSPTTGL